MMALSGVRQLVTHVGEETGLGTIRLVGHFARLVQPVNELSKLQLPILKLGDVGEYSGDPTIFGMPLAYLEPRSIGTLLFKSALRIAVSLTPLDYPTFTAFR